MDRFAAVKFRLNGLDAGELVALMKELLSAAAPHRKLPASIARAATAIRSAEATLRAANAGGTAADRKRRPGRAARVAADRAEDRAFRALYNLLTAWSQNDGDPKSQERAAQMIGLLFPDGLRFTQQSWRSEWSQAERFLAKVIEHKLGGEIAALGGASFVDHLRVVHARYGEAIGTTSANPDVATSAPPVGQALAVARAAVRSYLRKIGAHVESSDGDPAATALAESLLAPLRRAPTRAPRAAATGSAPAEAPIAA